MQAACHGANVRLSIVYFEGKKRDGKYKSRLNKTKVNKGKEGGGKQKAKGKGSATQHSGASNGLHGLEIEMERVITADERQHVVNRMETQDQVMDS